MNCPMPGDEPRRDANALESEIFIRRRSHELWRTSPFFAGLVVIAGEFHPIPFRTRPLKPPAPMVLRVNTRESRSPPGLQKTDHKTILILRGVAPAARLEGPPITSKTKSPVLARGAFCLS